jgi:hypothetical protein
MFPKCIKIINKENFNKNEWKNAQILVEQRKVNVIEYDCVNEIEVSNKKYIALMLEYANAGVLLNYILSYSLY